MSMSREQVPADPIPMTRLLTPASPVLSLPADVAPFIGREAEVAAVQSILYTPTTRLLTVVGTGGVGKSRLVLRVASSLDQRQRRFDAVYFVALGAVTRPEMVLVTIGLALGVRDGGVLPLADGIVLALKGRETLVVLDTFEHLMAAKPVVTDLLARCPTLTVVVTSRVPLRIYGERTYRLAPMAVGTPDDAAGLSDAARLLVDRARAVRDDFALTPDNQPVVEEICARLDGLPLAIELAAARLAVLSPVALLQRMRQRLPILTRSPGDVPARQRTQRATVAWSYDLLQPAEQLVFRRLAWCADGFGLPVVEHVLADLREIDALHALENLVDANLVQHQPVGDDLRYHLLDTIREYGLEEAARRGETEIIAEAHARAMLAVVQEVEPHLYGRQQLSVWLDGLQRELDNIRLALDWFEHHDAAALARLSNALGQFWLRHSLLQEGKHWAQRSLDWMDPDRSPQRVATLMDLARMLMYQFDARAVEVQQEAWDIAEILADPGLKVQVAIGRLTRGLIQRDRVAVGAIMQVFDELGAFVRTSCPPHVQETVFVLSALGFVVQGEPDRADEMVDACLAVRPWVTPPDAVYAICQRARGVAAMFRGNRPDALALLQDALRQYSSFGERWTSTLLLLEIAAVMMPVSAVEVAWLHGASDRALGMLGLAGVFAGHPIHQDARAKGIQALGQNAWDEHYAAGFQAPTSVAIERALALEWPATPPLPAALPVTPTGEVLTPRELDVLRLIVDGLTDREIAQELGIKYRTTTTFVTRILTKLDVPSRTAAATTAIRLGIVSEA